MIHPILKAIRLKKKYGEDAIWFVSRRKNFEATDKKYWQSVYNNLIKLMD